MIKITVTGERGEGATTVAVAIARFLELQRQRVTYRGQSADQEREIRKLIEGREFLEFRFSREIEVRDPGSGFHQP
jgi:cytidylate kinase